MRTSIPVDAATHRSACALLMEKWRSARPWLSCLALAGFACATFLSVGSFAQANGPLNFGQNYFVRGDYVVAGAQGLNASFGADGFGTGIIKIPDGNPGITGVKSVPTGAEVIAAVLYWQTVEKVGIQPGQAGSGENGFFRPLLNNANGMNVGPAKGYSITGVPLPSEGTVGWSSGGCTGTSTGKLVRTYRANVVSLLPRDSSGNISANGNYEVRLPNVGNNTPLTLGATLVLIYREFDPTVPLNSIVIYDGAFNPGGAQLTMTQTMQGFYDAANSPVSRITHIVADGKSNKFQTVKLNGIPLPSLYGNNAPPFPGHYGPWDNPTWTFASPGIVALANFNNPVKPGDASAETQVVPTSSNGGCVSWGAVIIATTVQNSDGDGLLDVWKLPKAPNMPSRPGYCDAAVNEGKCTQGDANWVDLPGAVLGTSAKPHPDVYVQFDYMCSSPTDGNSCVTGDGTNYSFDPTLPKDPVDRTSAVDKVKAVYLSHGITLHVNEEGNQLNVHAIQELPCHDGGLQSLCIFPNPTGTDINVGVVAWPGGVSGFEREFINPAAPTSVADLTACAASPTPAGCVPRFQPAAAPSKHYGLFAHAVGQPKWSLFNGTLASVMQKGTTVTFTTSTPVGALNVLGPDGSGNTAPDPTCLNGGRVTIVGAVTNPNLNGTFCLNGPPQGDTFKITLGSSANASYTAGTDPSLAVVPPYTSSQSGIADVGGHHFVVSLGLWGNPAFNGASPAISPESDGQNPAVIASTLMHEQGHAIMTYAHGGPAAGALSNPQLYQSPLYQSVTTNCKVNYLSVMSYSRQLDLLDYSESDLAGVDKATLTLSGSLSGVLDITHWYVPWPLLDSKGNEIIDPSTGKPVSSPAKSLCSGAPPPAAEHQMTEVTGPADTFSFASGSNTDINFDGNSNENFLGACDWCNADLAQTDATGAYLSSSGPPFGGGGPPFGGGGPPFGGGGPPFGGGGPPFGGGGPPFGGGGPPFGGGGPPFGGGGEIDLVTAQSITPAPQNLTAVEATSARTITLQWTKPFGDIGAYNVYRSTAGGPFTSINAAGTNPPHTVVGNPPLTTFTDTVACNAGGYQYFVTAVQSAASTNPLAESTPSNIVPAAGSPKLTGCYTNTPPTVTLNNLSFPNPAFVQGSSVPITWSLQDDDTSAFVGRVKANASLVAIGPLSPPCPQTPPANAPTIPLSAGGSGITFNANQFTYGLNTDPLSAGCYFFQLTLDSAQVETNTSALQLGIDITNTDTTPHVVTTSLPAAIVGVAYSNTVSEEGGVNNVITAFKWTIVSGSVMLNGSPVDDGSIGISFQQNAVGVTNGTLSGTANTVGTYTFTAMVTDSVGNTGTQTLTLSVLPVPNLPALNYGQLQPTTSPSARCCVAMAFDPVSNSTLLFGGQVPGEPYIAVSETWKLQSGQWALLSPGTSPPARSGAAMVYDAAHNNIVLFGGTSITNGTLGPDLNDTWIWNGATGTWTQANPATSPPARRFDSQGMAFDPNTQTVVMFGGIDHTNAVFFSDTWVWNGTTWTQMTADTSPSARRTVLATDPSGNVLLFGGFDGTNALPDTWMWNGTNWNLLSPTTSPAARDVHNMVFNPNLGVVVLFGGVSDANGGQTAGFNDTWTWDGVTWTQLTPAATPPQRYAFGMDYDSALSAVMVFGGFTFNGPAINDTWGLAVVPQPAINLAVSGVPTASQVNLTWIPSQTPPAVLGYNVYRGTTSGGPYTKVNAAIVVATGFTDITAASGTTYYYVVTAVGSTNVESPFSNEAPATTPPLPPSGLTATPGSAGSGQITLNWTPSTTATVVGYNVYRGQTSGGEALLTSVASPPFPDTGVPGTTYYYFVTAVGPGNVESKSSGEVFAAAP